MSDLMGATELEVGRLEQSMRAGSLSGLWLGLVGEEFLITSGFTTGTGTSIGEALADFRTKRMRLRNAEPREEEART